MDGIGKTLLESVVSSSGSGTVLIGAGVIVLGVITFILRKSFQFVMGFLGIVTAIYSLPNIFLARKSSPFSWSFTVFSLGLACLFLVGTTMSALSYVRDGRAANTVNGSSPSAQRLLAYVPLSTVFLLSSFSYAYFSLSRAESSAFDQTLSRVDALYFSMGNLSTAGSGAIAATNEASRALVVCQQAVDLFLISVTFAIVVSIATRRASAR